MSEFSADSLSDAISAVFGNTDNASALQINDSAGVTRVTLGALGNGDYGLKVVSTDGSTVIIDGTSDMFRIAATGTMSLSQATGTMGTTTVTLSGLGTLSTTPANLGYMSTINGTTAGRVLGNHLRMPAAFGFVAGTSGGSPTNPAITPILFGRIYTSLDGSSHCVVTLENDNANDANPTVVYGTYYVLAQTAI